MATGRTTLTWLDKEGDASSVSVHTDIMNAGNIATINGLLDDLVLAISDVTLCVLAKDTRFASEVAYAPSLPTAAYAERGIKFLVRMRDTNGNAVNFHIPGANLGLAGLMIGQSVDLTSTEGAALVSAIEAVVRSNDGEAVTVQEIVYID